MSLTVRIPHLLLREWRDDDALAAIFDDPAVIGADDFDHPHVPEGHPLRRHVLYRISRERDPMSARTGLGHKRRSIRILVMSG